MTPVRHLARFALAAAAPATLFIAQTWLVVQGEIESVLALARYAGLLGLLFFAFDGNSGLVPALMRLRHSETSIRLAYRIYRLGIAAVFLMILPIFWWLAPAETGDLLPFLAGALLLRFPWLDVDLDQRGQQHWSMMVQNGWMPALALAAVLTPLEATLAGHAALWSSLALAIVHWRYVRAPVKPATKFWPALMEILRFMSAQGIGQLYGRVVLFGLGAGFSGPLPSLVVYAKQVFNAAGLVATYLRRVELARPNAGIQLSLAGQGAMALVSAVIVALAAIRLDVAGVIVLALIGWQVFEKLSANAIYLFQLRRRHDLALAGLLVVAVMGGTGLGLAMLETNALAFVAFESAGYCLVLFTLAWLLLGRTRSGAAAAS